MRRAGSGITSLSGKFPCIFPRNREFRDGDGFADDCLHRQFYNATKQLMRGLAFTGGVRRVEELCDARTDRQVPFFVLGRYLSMSRKDAAHHRAEAEKCREAADTATDSAARLHWE
jgi:hypothetical protein